MNIVLPWLLNTIVFHIVVIPNELHYGVLIPAFLLPAYWTISQEICCHEQQFHTDIKHF